MFEKARDLVLTDRAKAKKALLDELKREDAAALNDQLDELESEAHADRERKQLEAEQADRVAEARSALTDARRRQHAAAVAFDAAVAKAGEAFEELELLSATITKLEQEIGSGDGDRPSVMGHRRSGALVGAIWHLAGPLAKRIGVRRTPGGPSRAKPLIETYPTVET